mgnify:CR=1 FL=1
MKDKKQIGAIILFLVIPVIIAFLPKSAVEPDEDGTYCARIDYYDLATGKELSSSLPVEVEDTRIIKVYTNEEGWLDEGHFDPEDISDGATTITTFEGQTYKIKLKYFGRCD